MYDEDGQPPIGQEGDEVTGFIPASVNLSRKTGIPAEAAGSLLGIAAPLILGQIG